MAEEKEKLKKTKTRSTNKPTAARRAGSKPGARVKRAKAEKSALDEEYEALDLSGPDDQDEDGEEMLRTYVSRVVAKRSNGIAKTLAKRAEQGSVTSAKLVLELVKKKKQPKKPSSKGLSNLVSTLECDGACTQPATQETRQTTIHNS